MTKLLLAIQVSQTSTIGAAGGGGERERESCLTPFRNDDCM